MTEEFTGNLLVVQAGKPTAVVNACLAGIVNEALNHLPIEEIYGGLHGIQGVLNEDIIDLAEESQQVIRGLRSTPSSVLGTGRVRKLSGEDADRLHEVFKAHNVRFLLVIGGKRAQQLALDIDKEMESRGYSMRTIGVPATIENDLPVTDHCPGYGSATKYLASTIREMGLDHQGIGQHDFVSIVEVMGRASGWGVASTGLAKRRNHDGDPPHLILFPEVIFNPDTFIERVQYVLKTQPYCMVVAGEGLVDDDGNYIAVSNAADSNAYAEVGGVGRYLQELLSQRMPNIRVATSQLGLAQRAAIHCASKVDSDESYECGVFAVKEIVSGESGKMVTLVRSEGDVYGCELGLVVLDQLVEPLKTFPHHWIDEDGTSLNYQYVKYANPLIQGEVTVEFDNGLPKYIELAANRPDKHLPPYHANMNAVAS